MSDSCFLCPRNCGAHRSPDTPGICGARNTLLAARASLHMWEEPCISGENGSGTVFFSTCPLKCVFCQNREISKNLSGFEITPDRLAEIFFELEAKGAHNINLVSPTPFTHEIAYAIKKAKQNGIRIPFVYNTSGYEKAETLKILDGLIDIYLPDFKYMSPTLAKRYSSAENYPEFAKSAIAEMVRQCPNPVFDDDGMMKKGVIVRHLVLPDCTDDSKEVIKHLYTTHTDSIYISIMSQYTPLYDLPEYPELMRKITPTEYDEVVDFALSIGVTQGFIQDGDSAQDSFIPVFDGYGICGKEQL